MKYATAAAFRQALEQRIQREAQEKGLSHVRVRKLIAFDRFLARLLAAAPQGWVLKGGVALSLRWSHHARFTKDLDLGRQDSEEEATEHLLAAASLDLGDFFVFRISRTHNLDAMQEGVTVRYRATAELAGRRFEDIIVDIGFGDPLVPEADLVTGLDFLVFAGIERLKVPTVALEQHIAEKLHAYTRSYAGGTSTRVKDLIDLVLSARYDAPSAGRLQLALHTTFTSRGTHRVPRRLPPPPAEWAGPYAALAQQADLDVEGDASAMRSGYEQIVHFLQPILDGSVPEGGAWDAVNKKWQVTGPSGSQAKEAHS